MTLSPGYRPHNVNQMLASVGQGSTDITSLLRAWSDGDADALDRLMPLVYDRLRRLAASFLKHEREDLTLETRALVHEAYLRLLRQDRVRWNDRAHFFTLAARIMRRILVDHARHRAYRKRGGGTQQVPLDELRDAPVAAPRDVLALDEALVELARVDPEQAQIVELRYFGGIDREEIAAILGISSATVTRRWRMARAWLFRYLCAEPVDV